MPRNGTMKIIYTKHATKKFDDLAQLGIVISKDDLLRIIKNPLYVDSLSDFPNTIATGDLFIFYVLRVVYRAESDKIIVITFYPARKGRYL